MYNFYIFLYIHNHYVYIVYTRIRRCTNWYRYMCILSEWKHV